MHRLNKYPVPEAGQIHYRLVTEGLRKMCDKPVKQAELISHDILNTIFNKVNLNNELETVAGVAVLIGFNMVLQVSNLGPYTRDFFDPRKHLCRSDYQLHNQVPSLLIRWSKTIQHRNKSKWVPIVPAVNKLCPQ